MFGSAQINFKVASFNKLIICAILFLFISTCCPGQIFNITQFDENDSYHYYIESIILTGEYDNYRVHYIFTDMQGFVWFGCDKGILRYDGARFKDFTRGYIKATMSPFSEVNCIRQDTSGVIWFGNQQGLVKYEPSFDEFSWIKDESGPDGSWAWNQIKYMINKGGYIWIASNHGISRYSTATGMFDHHLDISEFEGKMAAVNDLYLGDDKTLFFSTVFSHYKYDIAEASVSELEDSPRAYCSFYRDDFGNIWLSAYTGLFLYDSVSSNFTRMLSDSDAPNYMGPGLCVFLKHNEKHGYWVGVNEGFYKYSNVFEKEYFLHYDQDDVTGFRVDEDGTAWFATSQGIHKVIRKHHNFNCLPSDHRLHSSISSIVSDDSLYWLSDYSEIHGYTYDFRHVKSLEFHTDKYDRKINPTITQILFDREGRLWMGSIDKGLYRCEDVYTSQQLVRIFPGSGHRSDIPDKKVTSLFEDSEGRIWIGTHGHMACYYDPDLDRVIYLKFKEEPEFPVGLARQMYVLAELENGVIVSGTNHGLIAFQAPFKQVSEDTLEITNYQNYVLPVKDNMDYHHINNLHRYAKANLLWATTVSSGLICFKINGGQLSNGLLEKQYEITIDEGLKTNEIRSIAEDGSGDLWLGTKTGLIRFEPGSGVFSFFGEEDGLQSEIFNSASVLQDSEGRIIFGTRKGVLSFYPDSMKHPAKIPPVIITDIYINDNSIYNDSLLSAAFREKQIPIKLGYAQRNLNIEFACLNFIHPEKNQFRYKLVGQADDWVMNGNLASVLFSDLKPGIYTFFVEAGTGYGVWNHEGDSVAFLIRNPPWLTIPAFIVYLAIAALLIYLSSLYIQSKARFLAAIQVEKMEKEQVRELDEMKSRFFANISHEFRTPLTLILGYVRDLEKQPGNKLTINRSAVEILGRNARRLRALINQLLDISKLEKNALQLHLKMEDLSGFLRLIISSFQSLAESRAIQFVVEIEDYENELCFDPDKLEKIVVNLLSNAFKFTPNGGKVVFHASYYLEKGIDGIMWSKLVVMDNGIGIKPDQVEKVFDRFYQVDDKDNWKFEGSGIGLSLTRELVELLHGTITVQSKPGKGTAFTVMLPVSENCYPEERILEMQEVKDAMSEHQFEEDEAQQQENAVLVVEDNPDLRRYLVDQLSASYRVLQSENGKEGFEAAKKHLPDLVISDLMMPVMSGVEMTEKLKLDPATNHIPVIMLTAKADKESRMEGLDTGADDYVIKPFDTDELLVRVRNLILQRELLRNKFTQNYLLETDKEEKTMQYKMLREILDAIKHHLGDSDFNLAAFARELHMTRSQLFRKIRSITGTTPNELLRIVKMKHAAHLLRSSDLNVTQVMYEVGLQNTSHFAKSFKKYYGVNPAEFKVRNS